MDSKCKYVFIIAMLLNIVPSFVLAQTQQTASPYLSYDWAFFELKGRVRAVTIVYKSQYSETKETHYFNRNGELQGEEAYVDGEFENPYGYTRDDKGRIDGTGNGHHAWTWRGKTLVREDYGHMGSSATYIYTYNSDGKRTGYKNENGKFIKYSYEAHDGKGNWTSRSYREEGYYTETRKIVYY